MIHPRSERGEKWAEEVRGRHCPGTRNSTNCKIAEVGVWLVGSEQQGSRGGQQGRGERRAVGDAVRADREPDRADPGGPH